jgi:site-specific DNA-cytosine methylase
MKVSLSEKNKLKIGIFSFFSGAGFLDLGFEKSGYDVLFANEICKDFAEVYTFARKQMNMQSVTPDRHSVEDYVDPENEQYKNLQQKIVRFLFLIMRQKSYTKTNVTFIITTAAPHLIV